MRPTKSPAFNDVMFVTMAIPVERRLITLAARARPGRKDLPAWLLADVRKDAQSRLHAEVARFRACDRADLCDRWVRQLSSATWRSQDRYLPACRLAPPTRRNHARSTLRCALETASRLSRYEQLNGLNPDTRRLASTMHRQTTDQLSRMCRN
jgi:hypothetical protein